MIEKEKFCVELIGHLKSQNPEIQHLKINEYTNLVSEGVVDSMSLVELMVFVEQLTETPIDFENFDIKDAQTIDSLYKTLVLLKHIN